MSSGVSSTKPDPRHGPAAEFLLADLLLLQAKKASGQDAQEAKSALLQDVLAELKELEKEVYDTHWMFDHRRQPV